jgi:UDP-N-acetylmuramyl pentapeptide phosphotransferase/UDP-N-acetylglucosamine-1-phosphate transferase
MCSHFNVNFNSDIKPNNYSKKEGGRQLLDRILRWLMFGVLVALIPFLFTVVSALLRNYDINWYSILSHGELLLITVCICAGALGDLLSTRARSKGLELLLGGFATIIVILASYTFSDISSSVIEKEMLNKDWILQLSLWFFSAGFIVSLTSISIKEG